MNDRQDHAGGHRGRKFRGKRLKTALPRPPADVPPPKAKAAERIAKVMARAGLCSRREAEAWIAAGRVAVNGAPITSPALNVAAGDRITVDGKPLPQRERTRLFLFHKPRGLVTTSSDPQGRPTIFGALPKDLPRLVSVGRLDLNTEGLLLLTNDGGLARALELPATGWLRRYRVRAHGTVTQARLDGLRHGIEMDGVRYGPIEAVLDREQGANVWLTFAMREGKNREIRNVLGHLGLAVNRLIRVSYGPFQLGELPPGAIAEVRTRALREQLGHRLAVAAGADFSGPVVEREVDQQHPPTSFRRPEAQGAKPSGRGHGDDGLRRKAFTSSPRSGGEGRPGSRSEASRGGEASSPKRPRPPTPSHHALRGQGEGKPRRERPHKRRRPR